MRLFVRETLAIPLTAALLTLSACGGDSSSGPDPDPDPEVGAIDISVTADGAVRPGVSVSLFRTGGSNELATVATNASGEARIEEVEVGTYEVEVDPPAGLILADGEMARKTVTVTAGGNADVSFALVDDPGSNVVEVLVRSDNFSFDPATIEIEPGTTVRWRATGSIAHTITPDQHSEWASAAVSNAGDTFTHTFDEAGTFDYYCQPHRPNMAGTVVVQ